MKNTECEPVRTPNILGVARWLLGLALFSPCLPPLGVNIRPLVWNPLIAFAGVILIQFGKMAMPTLRNMNPWIWAVLAYIAASVFWSSDPVVSEKRVVLELGIALTCIAFIAPGNSSSWFISVLRPLITSAVLLSIIVALAAPEYGIHDGAWNGIFGQKNHLGQLCVLCALLWTLRPHNNSSSVILQAFIIALCAAVTVLTHSATALVIFIGVFGALFVIRMSRLGWAPVCIFGLISMLLIGHVLGVRYGYPTPLKMWTWMTGLVDRAPNLTGRTDLWSYLWSEAWKHPWFGTGYGAFWVGSYDDSATAIPGRSWDPDQGHNGYLDIFNQLGIVGLVLVSLLFITHARRLLALRRVDPGIANLHISLFLCIVTFSITESVLFRGPSPWIIVLWVSLTEVSSLSYMYKRAHSRLSYALHARREHNLTPTR